MSSQVNKEAIRKWVNALRSGEYEQTRECLKDGHGFCCLGVVTDLFGDREWRWDDFHDHFWYMNEDFFLPEEIREKLGLDTGRVEVEHPTTGEVTDLVSLNDGDERFRVHSFKEIADILEYNFL